MKPDEPTEYEISGIRLRATLPLAPLVSNLGNATLTILSRIEEVNEVLRKHWPHTNEMPPQIETLEDGLQALLPGSKHEVVV